MLPCCARTTDLVQRQVVVTWLLAVNATPAVDRERRQVPLLSEYVDRQTSRRWHPVWLFDTFSRPQFRFQATDVLMNCP